MFDLIKLAAPQIQGQRRNRRATEYLEFTGDRFKRASLEPAEGRAYDGSCIAMEFNDKRRQQSKRMMAEHAKETTDRNGIGMGQGDQSARIASMPPKMTGLATELAAQRFRELLILKTPKILVDLRFNQEFVESTISALDWTQNQSGSSSGFQLGRCIFQNNGFSSLKTLKTWMQTTVTSTTRHIINLFTYYRVPTKRLNEQVRRNMRRFPGDFMFHLTQEEDDLLRSQFATSNDGHGGRRYLPFAFTEQGVAMLSSVLSSERAISVNIQIMRAFAKIREMILNHKDLQKKIDEMEKKYDQNFKVVFDALRKLLQKPEDSHARVKGFISA